ncbi:complement decay-accelerating factor isoform X2 [Archocentrus centrarchus]|uniref:complement decay-accelerating factor isoform X2 n=1 Tax=Archocentrus centrarchus TaxID=63155 RepID=UPI0011EA1C18|nr:complement decay-accelerating factor-like isoform X2 [Archocentrus centrarchus]
MDTRGQRRFKSLLLMYLFVVKAAGDCLKPERRKNIVLTDNSLLMNDFPENVEITLECSDGYIKESGSEVITCVNNEWTKSDLVCKKKDCGQPPPVEHMNFDTSSGTLYGAVLKVTCDKGYQISGTSYKRCFALGWSGKAKCEIVSCDTPPEIANGMKNWTSKDDPEFGKTIKYTCNTGYSLIGNSTIMCTETGEYSSLPPECKEVRTTVPAPTSQSQAWTATVPPSPAAPTVHGAKTNRASTTTILSTLPQGFRGSLTAEAKAATPTVTSATSSSFQDMDDGVVVTGNYIVLVAVSVTVVLGAVTILVCIWLKFSLRRKGSYDTKEDQKPGLLHFQNL